MDVVGNSEGCSSTLALGLERNYRRISLWIFIALAMAAAWALVDARAALADVGQQGFAYGANAVYAPTGEKPQSKLWFNDGAWWGSLFNNSTEEHHIYRFDRGAGTWSDTGTVIDTRNSAKSDVLWNGKHLYVATATPSSTTSSTDAHVRRYSYDPATRRYALDQGFPVRIATGAIEAIVLDQDTTGKLWVTYTQGNRVYVNRSLGGDSTWGTPFVLPVAGTSVTPDDISSVIAFGSKVGVMWSNQNDGTMYFATHDDGAPGNAWQREVALRGSGYVDDHINLKSDSNGRVFATIKTSLNDVANPDPKAPLILLLSRNTNGAWRQPAVVGRVEDDHTRPIMAIDETNRKLYVFATAACCDGGTIYYKQANLDGNISFPEGRGTPLIQSSTHTHVNNATSTKQNASSATGLLVLASDDISKYYLHNTIDLTPPRVTSTGPANGARTVLRSTNVTATFSEAMNPATLTNSTVKLTESGSTRAITATVSYDRAARKVTLNPTYDLRSRTTYTVTIAGGTSGAKDEAGNALAANKVWSFQTGSRKT